MQSPLQTCPSCERFIQKTEKTCPFCHASFHGKVAFGDRLQHILCVGFASVALAGAIAIPGCAYGDFDDSKCTEECTTPETCELVDETRCDDDGVCEDGAYMCVIVSDSTSNGTSSTSNGTSGGSSQPPGGM